VASARAGPGGEELVVPLAPPVRLSKVQVVVAAAGGDLTIGLIEDCPSPRQAHQPAARFVVSRARPRRSRIRRLPEFAKVRV